MEAIPGKHSINALWKTAICCLLFIPIHQNSHRLLGTSYIIWKVLQSETGSLSAGDHHWFKRSTREKRPMTRNIDDNNIIIRTTYSKYRLCIQFDETMEHISIPVGKTIHNRHDRVYAQLHFNMCKEREAKLDNEHWHDHVQYQN
jgi:hypothetical protein